MPTLITFILLAVQPVPLSLDGVSLERARSLHGQLVASSFLVAKPPYTLLGRTMVGAADRDDGAERGVVLVGKRYDVEVGTRLSVVGVLRVIEHRADFVGGVPVPAWSEVRVEEPRP